MFSCSLLLSILSITIVTSLFFNFFNLRHKGCIALQPPVEKSSIMVPNLIFLGCTSQDEFSRGRKVKNFPESRILCAKTFRTTKKGVNKNSLTNKSVNSNFATTKIVNLTSATKSVYMLGAVHILCNQFLAFFRPLPPYVINCNHLGGPPPS